jgi:outer membrane murein-binding lipoprotein Lpp
MNFRLGELLSPLSLESSLVRSPSSLNRFVMQPDQATAASSAPGVPPGGWEKLMNLIEGTNTGVTSLQAKMDTVTTDLSTLKTDLTRKIEGLETKQEELGAKQDALEQKQEALEQKYEELSAGIDHRFDALRDEVLGEVTEEVQTKLRDWRAEVKNELKNEIMEELRAAESSPDINADPPVVCKSAVGQKFQQLIRLSRALENNFCMGPTKSVVPTTRAAVLLRRYFPEFDLSIAKGNMKIVRFSVQPKAGALSFDFRAKLQEVRGSFLAHGWWIAQENPADLRAMYTVANDFLKIAKANSLELKAFFLSIERGWVYYREEPLVPVFLIPSDNTYWTDLADILLVKLKESNKVDWLIRATGAMKPDSKFLEKWVGAMRLQKELADALIPKLVFQEQNEGEERMDEENLG